MSQRALVTGGAGFIGSHLCDALLERGWRVAILDDLSTGLESNVPAAASFHEGSILSDDAIVSAVAGCDTVFHLAASVSVPYSIDFPSESFRVNALGTLNVIEAARRSGVKRFIYSSSSAVYGDTCEGSCNEESLPNPLSPYAAGKLAGEEIVTAYARSFEMRTVSLRYFNIFGPRQRPDSAYAAAIPIFMRRLMNGEPITVYGDGEQTRDFTFVSNAVAANLLAAEAKSLDGGALNCATGLSITVNQLIAELASVLDANPQVEFVPARPGEVRLSSASVDKAARVIGYKAAVDWRDGLRATAKSFSS